MAKAPHDLPRYNKRKNTMHELKHSGYKYIYSLFFKQWDAPYIPTYR